MREYVEYPEYYDWDHVLAEDIPFYLEYARQSGSPVLELACGTGRALLPLAEAGFSVFGIDVSEGMLRVCASKVTERRAPGRVTITRASMTDFELAVKDFALAFVAARSFMHLPTQAHQTACLRRAFDHLRRGGLFIVDVYAPSFAKLASPPDDGFKVRKEFDLPNGHHVVRKDRFVRNDVVNQVSETEILFEEYDGSGRLVRSRMLPMDTRYTFRFELQLLLERAGFEIVDLFGGYDGRPYDGAGEIIFVARKP